MIISKVTIGQGSAEFGPGPPGAVGSEMEFSDVSVWEIGRIHRLPTSVVVRTSSFLASFVSFRLFLIIHLVLCICCLALFLQTIFIIQHIYIYIYIYTYVYTPYNIHFMFTSALKSTTQ